MQTRSLVSVNGRISPPEDARISVLDRGFLFGDAVYETGRSYDRCCVFLEEHWARLKRSSEKLEIPTPWTPESMTSGLHKLLKEFGEPGAYFRTIVTRGEVPSVGIDVDPVTPPTVVHIATSLNAEKIASLQATGLSVLTANVVRNAPDAQDPNIKTSNYLNSLLALQDVRRRGGKDAILCDRNGNVTEGTTFSIFAVSSTGELWTPSLEVGILDSITRRHVLDTASGEFKTKEGAFPLKDFQNCPEVFIASSVRQIVPITEWDGVKYSDKRPVTRRLQQKLNAVIQGYISSHPKY